MKNSFRLSFVGFAAITAIAVLFVLFARWLTALNSPDLLSIVPALLSLVGVSALVVKCVPALERYWGVEPTVLPKPADLPIYIKIAAYIIFFGAVYYGLIWQKFGGSLPSALLRYCGGYQTDPYYYGGTVDIPHYFNLTRFGYVNSADDLRLNIVFFPLYPILLKTLDLVFRNLAITGILLNLSMIFGSGVLMYKIVQKNNNAAEASRAVKYMYIFPTAFYLFIPMSESLFLFLTLAFFYFLESKKYYAVFVFAFLAGLTRSLGITLFAPLVIELGRAVFKRKGKRAVIALSACVLAPLCALAVYLLINSAVYGDPFMFAKLQKEHWGQGVSYFWNTASYLFDYAKRNIAEGSVALSMGVFLSGLICLFGALSLIIYGAKRLKPTYTAYAAAYFVTAFGATWLLSAPRYTLCLFPLAMSLSKLTAKKAADYALTTLYGGALLIFFVNFFTGAWTIY